MHEEMWFGLDVEAGEGKNEEMREDAGWMRWEMEDDGGVVIQDDIFAKSERAVEELLEDDLAEAMMA